MIDTHTATAADLAAEKPNSKKSSPTKKSAPKKKAVSKKTVRKPTHSEEKKASSSKAPATTKPLKQTESTEKVAQPKTTKADKLKKPKLVRDSFTMPKHEYAVLGHMKKTCLAGGVEIKKSELLRIGVAQLAAMDLKKLKAAQAALTPLKAGRPKKAK